MPSYQPWEITLEDGNSYYTSPLISSYAAAGNAKSSNKMGTWNYFAMENSDGSYSTDNDFGYDANYYLLSDNGGFLTNNQAVTTSWQYFNNFCVGSGSTVNTFASGTTFLRPRITISSNTGTVYFDAFSIFIANAATIAQYY